MSLTKESTKDPDSSFEHPGGRVPIKEVRQEIEAAAEGSIRIAANTTSRDSENAQASLSALLSDSNNDWLIDEKDLEILVDEHGRPIKLGSGSFGTASPFLVIRCVLIGKGAECGEGGKVRQECTSLRARVVLHRT